MAKRQVKLEGITTTGLYMTVHFTTGERAAKRVEQIRIPWEALLGAEVWRYLDKAEAKRLRQHWGCDEELFPPW